MPDISVILPTYNRSSTISRSIESVLSQTYKDFEFIVVDDFSTDDTHCVVENYSSEIKYIRHETNRGAAAARNTGIKNSSGEYIAFIDSDDEWHPEKLERQIEIFSESSSDVGVVYTGFYKCSDNKRELGNIPTKRGYIYEDQLMKDWVNPTSTTMVRSACFESVGGFNPELNARQDYELWIRIARNYQFEYIKEPLVTMYVGNENRITGNVEVRMNAHKQVLDSIEEEIRSLSWKKRQRCFASQYFSMGRYLQKNQSYSESSSYFIRSLKHNPLKWKTYGALFLSLARYDTQGSTFIKIKNFLRKVNNR